MRKQFNSNANHTMDHAQFSEILYQLKTKTNTGRRSVENVAFDARQVSASEEEFMQTNNQLVDKIFENKKQINYDDFLELRKQMHEDLLHYLFFTGADENDEMSIEDFLKQTIICVKFSKHHKYLKRIGKVVEMFEKEGVNKKVKIDEFLAFQGFLDDIESIKRKVAALMSIDFDIFEEIFQDYEKFVNKKNKGKKNVKQT